MRRHRRRLPSRRFSINATQLIIYQSPEEAHQQLRVCLGGCSEAKRSTRTDLRTVRTGRRTFLLYLFCHYYSQDVEKSRGVFRSSSGVISLFSCQTVKIIIASLVRCSSFGRCLFFFFNTLHCWLLQLV